MESSALALVWSHPAICLYTARKGENVCITAPCSTSSTSFFKSSQIDSHIIFTSIFPQHLSSNTLCLLEPTLSWIPGIQWYCGAHQPSSLPICQFLLPFLQDPTINTSFPPFSKKDPGLLNPNLVLFFQSIRQYEHIWMALSTFHLDPKQAKANPLSFSLPLGKSSLCPTIS